jgi:hypothetical protein
MLLTPGRIEERIWHYVRDAGTLYATADDVARATGADAEDARHILDDLVARSVLRRFDSPGKPPIYWS